MTNIGWWMLAFLGFPIGGALATALIGRMDSPLDGAIGGLVAGLVIGAAQALALNRTQTAQGASVGLWVAATAVALAVGVGLSAALVGTETTLESILLRAAVTGAVLALAQAAVIQQMGGRALVWLILVAVLYIVAWFVTSRVIGASVDQGFIVFGASGALVYQLLTGLALRFVVFAPPGSG
ncbi:MAG: hypothetical protein SF162_08705 [bacterium]|nr:hypothetical protein [bacterium]